MGWVKLKPASGETAFVNLEAIAAVRIYDASGTATIELIGGDRTVVVPTEQARKLTGLLGATECQA